MIILQAEILNAAISYIDSLHNRLIESIQERGFPPSVQQQQPELLQNGKKIIFGDYFFVFFGRGNVIGQAMMTPVFGRVLAALT